MGEVGMVAEDDLMKGGAAGGPRIVCVLGMHRSGTSLIARLLNLLGVDLGPEVQLLPPNVDNPRGFWEHEPFRRINEAILARLGGGWDAPPAFPPDWAGAPELADLRARAEGAIAESFAKAELWGWKDPRACVTLPFWQSLLPRMRYVICLRNVVDVARSLEARNDFPPEKSGLLWLTYVSSMLQHTTGDPRIIVSYEQVLTAWRTEIERLARFVGQADRLREPGVMEAIEAAIDIELQHHRTGLLDVASEGRIPLVARTLYLGLRTAAAGAAEPDDETLRAWAVCARESASEEGRRREAAEQAVREREAAEQAVREREDLLSALRESVSEEGRRREAAEQAVREREDLLSALRSRFLALEAEISEDRRAARQAARELEGARARVASLEQERAILAQSAAWKLVNRYRRMVGALLPGGSRRREAYARVLRAVSGAPAGEEGGVPGAPLSEVRQGGAPDGPVVSVAHDAWRNDAPMVALARRSYELRVIQEHVCATDFVLIQRVMSGLPPMPQWTHELARLPDTTTLTAVDALTAIAALWSDAAPGQASDDRSHA